jgi:hypothetical protein
MCCTNAGGLPTTVARWNRSPSRKKNTPVDALQSSIADRTKVFRIGCRSNAERLITFSTSAVAVCCARASTSSAVQRLSCSRRLEAESCLPRLPLAELARFGLEALRPGALRALLRIVEGRVMPSPLISGHVILSA